MMLAAALPLLAQATWNEALRPLREGFHQESSDTNIYAIIGGLVGVCLLAVLADQLYRRFFGRVSARKRDSLTHAAHLLELRYGELRDLRTVAEAARLSQPAAMLLTPGNLARAVRVAQAPPRLQERMNRLCQRLHNCPLPAEA